MTHATNDPPAQGAHTVNANFPILFNQNFNPLIDTQPPFTSGSVTTSALAVPDPSGSGFTGYTDINLTAAGNYYVTFAVAYQNTGGQAALANKGAGVVPVPAGNIIINSKVNSGAGNQLIADSSIVSIAVPTTLWVVNATTAIRELYCGNVPHDCITAYCVVLKLSP